MFIDEVSITIKAGDGGRGTVSFRKEKFIARGGPDGGDGGRGGSVYLLADGNINTLSHFRGRHTFRALDGRPGGRNKRTGKSAEDLTIRVPPGTRVRLTPDGTVLFELNHAGERKLLARGGKGGKGNSRFATSTNQAPRKYEEGEAGEELKLSLELLLHSHVALIGKPNAGKSSILRAITNATPKVSGYPFTTLNPYLGVVDVDDCNSFVVSDLPGIIAGAHQGVGLGDRFLRHIERSAILCVVVDVSEENPAIEDLQTVLDELRLRNPELAQKVALVIANKMDLPSSQKGLKELTGHCELPILSVSALTGQGLDRLVKELHSLVKKHDHLTEATEDGSGL
jgi:GTP-binding protein